MKKPILNELLILIAFLMLPNLVFAAPYLSSYSGTASDGNSLILSGTDFGANTAVGTAALEFLGGKNGPIETGTTGAGFSRSRWDVMRDWDGDIVYSTNHVLFGSKILQMQGGGTWPEVPLTYNFPTPVTSSDHIFVSWWERVTWAGNGQYKIIRFSPTETVIDGNGQTCMFFHNNDGGLTFGPYEYPNDGTLYPDFSPATPQSIWERFDIDITTSSNTSGAVTFTKYIPGQSVETEKYSSYHTHYSGLNWNYIVWQNYFGTDGSGSMTAGDVWFDDIFVQHGSPARVELCDNAAWANRQQCIVQYPTSWPSSSSVTITLNAGNFASGTTRYLFLIDSTGAISNSIPVIIGSGDSSPPAAPTGLTIVENKK